MKVKLQSQLALPKLLQQTTSSGENNYDHRCDFQFVLSLYGHSILCLIIVSLISPRIHNYCITKDSHISSINHSVITVCRTYVERVSGQYEVFTVSTGLLLGSQTYCDTWRGGKWRGRGSDASERVTSVSYQKGCIVD